MTASSQAIELTVAAAHSALEVKAENLVALDVSGHLALADVFLIASGSSERQVTAIAERIEDDLAEIGSKSPTNRPRARP